MPDLLHSILSQPSAPFREHHVIERLTAELDQGQVPWFKDATGNIVVGASSEKDYLKTLRRKNARGDESPLRVFIAHMDHPGFHVTGTRAPGELEFKWHGGSPTKFLEGAKVWLADRQGFVGYGEVIEAKLLEGGRAIESGVIRAPREFKRELDPAGLYGGFAFREPVWQEGRLVYTKAADDLVGCFAIVELAKSLFSKPNRAGKRVPRKPIPFIGLLTRAEEVGFIGAIGHFEQGWFKKAKRPLVFVSLETSRALPGAEIGKGPVVRLGDRYTVFDARSLRVFTDVAERRLPTKYQRRVMDGGTCEGTTAIAYGHRCVGISVPLGNYHNQGFEGGSDSRGPLGPAPEFVHLDDVGGMIELCHGLMEPKLEWTDPFAAKIRGFKQDLKNYKALLKSGP